MEGELDELVRQFEHRVPYFANRVQRRFMMGSRWRDELVSAGYWGLFKALRNRRPDAHERELSAYVSRRVQGAVIDEARLCLTHSSRASSAYGDALHGLDDASTSADHAGSGDMIASTTSMRAQHGDPEAAAARRWRQQAIDDALSELEPEGQAVIRAYMAGDTLSEIARARGISAGTMQVRFQKLVRKVRSRSPRLRRILLDHDCA